MSTKEVSQLKLDMQSMKDDIKYIKEDLGELKKTLKDFIDKADGKYAGKWVEKIWAWVLLTVGTGTVGAIGYAIIHAYTDIQK